MKAFAVLCWTESDGATVSGRIVVVLVGVVVVVEGTGVVVVGAAVVVVDAIGEVVVLMLTVCVVSVG